MLTLAGILNESYEDELKIREYLNKHIKSREPLKVNVDLKTGMGDPMDNTLTYDAKSGHWVDEMGGESFNTDDLLDLIWVGENGQLLFDY